MQGGGAAGYHHLGSGGQQSLRRGACGVPARAGTARAGTARAGTGLRVWLLRVGRGAVGPGGWAAVAHRAGGAGAGAGVGRAGRGPSRKRGVDPLWAGLGFFTAREPKGLGGARAEKKGGRREGAHPLIQREGEQAAGGRIAGGGAGRAMRGRCGRGRRAGTMAQEDAS